MHAEPQQEHRWLQKLIGEWTYDAECGAAPGQPPAKCSGSERVRALGALWVICEGAGEMPGGGSATTLLTLGYDTTTRRYVGAWIGSMMAHLWIYDGELDSTGKILTLNAEGPTMAGEGTAKYRDVIEFKSDDLRVMTSHLLGEDGRWQQFMTAQYRRKN